MRSNAYHGRIRFVRGGSCLFVRAPRPAPPPQPLARVWHSRWFVRRHLLPSLRFAARPCPARTFTAMGCCHRVCLHHGGRALSGVLGRDAHNCLNNWVDIFIAERASSVGGGNPIERAVRTFSYKSKDGYCYPSRPRANVGGTPRPDYGEPT